MEELYRKIKEERQKQVEIENSRMASIKEKLVQETNIGLQYVDVVYDLDKED